MTCLKSLTKLVNHQQNQWWIQDGAFRANGPLPLIAASFDRNTIHLVRPKSIYVTLYITVIYVAGV